MISLPSLLLGVVVGLALAMGVGVMVMRTRMVVPHRSRRSFEDTCAAVERVVPEHEGWGFPIETWNFYETFRAKGLEPDGIEKLKVYFVCNAGFASRMLSHTAGFAGMMPCSWAVYETSAGEVFISKMNVGLMSRMFSGIPGATMAKVGEMDDLFLSEVLG